MNNLDHEVYAKIKSWYWTRDAFVSLSKVVPILVFSKCKPIGDNRIWKSPTYEQLNNYYHKCLESKVIRPALELLQ